MSKIFEGAVKIAEYYALQPRAEQTFYRALQKCNTRSFKKSEGGVVAGPTLGFFEQYFGIIPKEEFQTILFEIQFAQKLGDKFGAKRLLEEFQQKQNENKVRMDNLFSQMRGILEEICLNCI